jgi:hypothetical protein
VSIGPGEVLLVLALIFLAIHVAGKVSLWPSVLCVIVKLLLPLALILAVVPAYAADYCRDGAGKFTACPEVVSEPVVIPEPVPTPQPEPVTAPISVRAYAGGLTAVTTDADASLQPLASLQITAPLSKSVKGPSLSVQADLTALPGETVEFSDPTTFKAIEFGVAVVQPLGGPLLFSLYGEGGFASRLAVDSEPVSRLPAYWSGGLLFASADGDHSLKVGLGPDQRLSGEWAAAVHISGRAKVGERAGVSMYLVGSLIRALDLAIYGAQTPSRDSIRIGLAVGTN